MYKFIVSTTHGSFHVTEASAQAARAFALDRLAARYAGETVTVLAVTLAA